MARRVFLGCLAFALGLSLSAATPAGSSAGAGAAGDGLETAIFAGGCFWCVESDFDKVPGVVRTISGFTGGSVENPSYQQVSAGGTGHREAVKIVYDPEEVSYEQLLHVFWRSIDPTDPGGQFCDRGDSYESAIFAVGEEQRRLAEASKRRLQKSEVPAEPIVTPILAAGPFYPAERYHQNYYEKNPIRYTIYRYLCGRDARVREVWGDQAHDGIADD